jgi:hypothetical protein
VVETTRFGGRNHFEGFELINNSMKKLNNFCSFAYSMWHYHCNKYGNESEMRVCYYFSLIYIYIYERRFLFFLGVKRKQKQNCNNKVINVIPVFKQKRCQRCTQRHNAQGEVIQFCHDYTLSLLNWLYVFKKKKLTVKCTQRAWTATF